MSLPSFSAGQPLAGRYRLVAPLGRGVLGEVHAAIDQQGDRECAVKVLSPVVSSHALAWSTFQDTCRKVSSANADAIARITDFGLDANTGRHFFVSERIAFPALSELVSTRGPLPLSLWMAAFEVFARALEAAARIDVPHGDLKPENLFFSPEHPSWARITDFGIAALRAAVIPPAASTAFGWLSPEQMRTGMASHAADVFALGLIAFYALTGRHYLRAMAENTPNLAAVEQELGEPRARASEHAAALGAVLPAALDDWFARALHADPAARFLSALEAYDAFREAAESALAIAPPPSPGVAPPIAPPLVLRDLPPPASNESMDFAHAPTLPGEALRAAPAAPGPLSPAATPPMGTAPAPSERPAFGVPAVVAPTLQSPITPAGPQSSMNRPRLALLAAIGVGGLLMFVLGAWALVALFSDRPKRGPPIVAAPSATAPAASPEPGASATRARFECTPEPCESIVCDGKSVAKGSVEIEIAPGKHTCSAARRGYRTAVLEFTAKERDTTPVVFQLLASRAAPAPRKLAPASKAKVKATRAPKPAGSVKIGTKASKP